MSHPLSSTRRLLRRLPHRGGGAQRAPAGERRRDRHCHRGPTVRARPRLLTRPWACCLPPAHWPCEWRAHRAAGVGPGGARRGAGARTARAVQRHVRRGQPAARRLLPSGARASATSVRSMEEVFEIFQRLRERQKQLASTLSGGERADACHWPGADGAAAPADARAWRPAAASRRREISMLHARTVRHWPKPPARRCRRAALFGATPRRAARLDTGRACARHAGRCAEQQAHGRKRWSARRWAVT